MVVLFCKKLPQLEETFLFIRERNDPVRQLRQSFSLVIIPVTLYMPLKLFFYVASFHNLHLWSLSYSKPPLL